MTPEQAAQIADEVAKEYGPMTAVGAKAVAARLRRLADAETFSMTPADVKALIEKWREREQAYRKAGDTSASWPRYDGRADEARLCAQELEALLQAPAEQPAREVEPSCVCHIDDGLVQEWVSKVRAVAKSKGLL